MSERKVLNKYYPPDYDPRLIPKAKGKRSQVYEIRIMAPFNMKCNTCSTIIPKAKKFNSRKENVEGKEYLGLMLFRFYIRCPICLSEISFRTDLEHGDYEMEAGAKRCYEATRLAWIAEKEKFDKIALENENNPMAMVENRMTQSKQEMEIMENIEELKERSCKNAHITADDLLDMIDLEKKDIVEELIACVDKEEVELFEHLEVEKKKLKCIKDGDEEKDLNLLNFSLDLKNNDNLPTKNVAKSSIQQNVLKGLVKKKPSNDGDNFTCKPILSAYSDSD